MFFTLVHNETGDPTLDTSHCFRNQWAMMLHHDILVFLRLRQRDVLTGWLHSQLLDEILSCIYGTSWVRTCTLNN